MRRPAIHYLDHAATSALRPDAVARAMVRYMDEVGATPGRGGHRLALEAGRIVLRARRAVCAVLGLPGDPGRVVFGLNATHGLNLALRGILEPGDAVVVTAFDHNAVLRPVHHLRSERRVSVRLIPGDRSGALDDQAFDAALDGARLVVLNAVSNVLGSRLPVESLARRARAAGCLVLVDTAQSAGHVPVSLADADLVAFTGHKGLLGPQGVGGLWVRTGLEVTPLLRGGTGGDSSRREMPLALPDRLEAGTLNGPGIAGLLAGCEAVLEEGVEVLHRREVELKARLRDGLSALPGVDVLSPADPHGAGIVTLRVQGTDAGRLAHRLDRDHGVLGRSGLHCAPEAHRALGTMETGALRLSVGWGTTEADIDAAVEAVDQCARFISIPLG